MWHGHFFGEKILVNGKVWPYLNVKKGKYRFRVLNGSNSRTYRLSLSDGSPFWLIATDMGIRSETLELNEIVLTSGERADIIVDFSSYAPGTELLLLNDAPAPYPGFPGVGVIPIVMKFIVGNEVGFTSDIPQQLVEVPVIPEEDALMEREFNLMQMPSHCEDHMDGMWTINGLMWDDITEFPMLGTTEIWTWINNTGMSHPMHMHLVSFQIIDRIPIDHMGNETGPAEAPEEFEKGWKDTVNSLPGYKTSVIARFEGFLGEYPYHCHILEHEDHEMMRQFEVIPNTISGCTDPVACNYNVNAGVEDGSCFFNCAACAADLNGDGLVNTGDLVNFLNEFGCSPPATCSIGDFNTDGRVNVQDLLIFLAVFGDICDQP